MATTSATHNMPYQYIQKLLEDYFHENHTLESIEEMWEMCNSSLQQEFPILPKDTLKSIFRRSWQQAANRMQIMDKSTLTKSGIKDIHSVMWEIPLKYDALDGTGSNQILVAHAVIQSEADRIVRFLQENGKDQMTLQATPPSTLAKKDFYDTSGDHFLRLFQCCHTEYCDILMHGYETAFPNRKFCWVDSEAPDCNIVFGALPSRGASEIENQLFHSICSRLTMMVKTNSLSSKKAVFAAWVPRSGYDGISLQLFKRLFEVAWQRMADYRYWESIVATATPPSIKKYYAVIRGEMKGVFTDADRFKKAIEYYPNQLARVFDNESEALSWFHLMRGNADARKQQAKQSLEERWDLQNDALLTAASPSLRAKKYYAVARGFKTGIFIRNSEYLRAVEGFPDALARSFRTREEAEAWLHDPIATTIPTMMGKKYYAVARGKMTGIFTDVEMYNKATKGFSNAVARAFKTEDEAKAWLKLFKNENLPSGNMAKRERWAWENEALLAANHVVAPVSAKTTKEIRHTSNPNELLAARLNRFFGLPMQKESDVSTIFMKIPEYLKPETQNFLSFGQTKGYDYLHAGCSILTAKEDFYRGESPKKITAEWMKAANIPSSYKILINDFIVCCLRMAFFIQNSDIPQRQEKAATSCSANSSRTSSAPAPSMPKKHYVAVLGKRTVVFSDADTYEKLSRQFPDAPMRIFNSRKEADAWLREIVDNPSIWEKHNKTKYYAVARGKITGIFTDVEMYDKATRGFPDALARSFKNRNSAEAWLASVAEKTAIPDSAIPDHPITETLPIQESSRDNANACGITINASVISQKQNTERKKVLPVPEMNVSDAPVRHDVQKEHLDGTLMPSALSSPATSPSAKKELFHGVQFDKHIFRGMPAEAQQRFRKTFAPRLAKLGRIFHGSRDAGNDFKLVAPTGRRVFKRRIGKNRLSMVYKDGILTLLKFSTHDRQMADIRNLHGKSIGYVYYDVEDFLRQMEAWPTAKKDDRLTFGEYMTSPRHFVFDEDQKGIIESGEKSENLSVIGSAGAGKSIVGLKWLDDRLEEPNHDALYLTMSENLVYTLGFEFQKEASAERHRSKAEIRTTFDFLRESFKKRYPKTPEKNLLNAAQSFALFRRFWAEEVDWTQFWNFKDNRFALQSEEATLLAAWREIHGILKGAVPLELDYGKLSQLPETLPEEAYRERMRQEKKDSVRDVLWTDTLYRTYEKYQAYLRRRQLLDDNDVARMLLQKPPEKSRKYAAAFVDECQDLTQMELLAIFHLLSGVKEKRMSSDRCQMVQPTYFDEGWMRTTANAYDRHWGKNLEETGWKPRFLHYNYRSTRRIIDFQNYAVQYLRYSDILTLKQLETEEILVPPLTPPGLRPIWISPSEENQRTLIQGLWAKLDASDLQTVFAFKESSGKSDFPSDEINAATDILSCKGMEYPSVLLYNVLSETRFDPVMAWKYFYVGATRANHALLIYEKEAVPGTRIYEFLSSATKAGLLDRCENLHAQPPGESRTWLGHIYQCVSENAAENRLETAENALDFGQYELALSIYARENKDQNMIAYCRGKVMESRGDFHQAIEYYALNCKLYFHFRRMEDGSGNYCYSP